MNMNNFTFVYSIRIHSYSCIREPPGSIPTSTVPCWACLPLVLLLVVQLAVVDLERSYLLCHPSSNLAMAVAEASLSEPTAEDLPFIYLKSKQSTSESDLCGSVNLSTRSTPWPEMPPLTRY